MTAPFACGWRRAEPTSPAMLPALVAHADWSVHPHGRAMVLAARRPDGRFALRQAEPGDPASLLTRLAEPKPGTYLLAERKVA